jgi:hypothetical protein
MAVRVTLRMKKPGRRSEQGRMPIETRKPTTVPTLFPPRRDYASLSVKDLLDARDAYHVYLSALENVVATAVGRYCIHEDDWYAKNPPDRPRPKNIGLISEPRTLANSVIRPWSWPAVLVFVNEWQDRKSLGPNTVPRTLFLPDGRTVPTCVILATPDETLPPAPLGPFQTSSLLGGGYLCLRQHQGEQAVGTFSCLVRKAGTYYALTNRHVGGGDGEVVKAYVRGEFEPVGITSTIAVDRQPMSAIFPAWPCRVLLTLDAGLIRIEDINDWTTQAFGIGEIGDIFDATEQSVTLDLIGSPVRAFGGISGVTEGEIRALFFRHDSLGGVDYATDVLIGPRRNSADKKTNRPAAAPPFTRPGDSGSVWFYDPPSKSQAGPRDEELGTQVDVAERGTRARRLRPVAIQWGGQRVQLPDGTKSAYALGTFLSSVCTSLDVEVVRNWSLGHDEYWGKIGHFAIGWKACDRLSGALADLMKKNQERIGYNNDTISQGKDFRVGRDGFVPLADVPDYVWITQGMSKRVGPRTYEAIQHFADIDIYDITGAPSMLQRCVDDGKNLSAKEWKNYFDGFAEAGVGPDNGTLPFRVWQIWDAMVIYLRKDRDVLRFVSAAGVLAHYVGDASQPLHCSYMHHGVPPMLERNGRNYPIPKRRVGETSDTPEYQQFKATRGAKIHSIYEEGMLEVDPADTLTRVDEALANDNGAEFAVDSGHAAGMAVIRLMNDAQSRLSPEKIIDADDPTLGPAARAAALWKNPNIRDATVESLADSVRVLADLWSSAWKIGKGDRVAKSKRRQFKEPELDYIYRSDKKFVPSLSLEKMADSDDFEP